MTIKRFPYRILKYLIALAMILALTAGWPMLSLKIPLGYSSLIGDSRGSAILGFRANHQGFISIHADLQTLSPFLIQATLAAEDKRFFSHCGVDFLALGRAFLQDVTSHRIVSGASTLTMQVVRLLNPGKRSYWNKLKEILGAMILECRLNKNEILELYFNLAPYGGNRIGVEAASRKYLGKPSSDLSLGEACFLAGIPQSPTRFNPLKTPKNTFKRREYIFGRLLELNAVNGGQIEKARSQKIELKSAKFPDSLILDYYIGTFGKEAGFIPSTLVSSIQSCLSSTFSEETEKLKTKGIQASAAVVIDVKASSLAGLYCSIDPANPLYGSVNCALAKRQPGSLMKPFLYALAFEKGLLTPASVLWDVPSEWENYKPQNADKKYLGPLPASQALFLSRNVPAVRVLEQIGIKSFQRTVEALGILNLETMQDTGLSLALGTGETSLLKITNAYAALSRLGIFKNLQITGREDTTGEKRVFSEGASYLTLRSLSEEAGSGHFSFAYKTGTSWHQRDAWAVVMSPLYTVGVFMGRMDAKPNSHLKGRDIALPVALAIAEKIHAHSKENLSWPRPGSVATRNVCPLSGNPLTPFCDHFVEAEYLPGISPSFPCSSHFQSEPKRGKEPSPGNSGPSTPFKIVFPVKGATYVSETPSGSEMDLVMEPSSILKDTVFWFLDGELIADTRENHLKKTLAIGKHILTISDRSGYTDEISFNLCPLK